MSLELVNVTLFLAGKPLFAPLSAVAEPGTILTIMGPSGVGKSSLLDFIGGHLAREISAEGDIRLSGQTLLNLPAYQRKIGMLFQDASLFPHLSVAGNLAFGLTGDNRADRIAKALASVGLDGSEARDPATLSGGEKTRVALMRTLLSAPKAVLLDEPFAKLDQTTRASVRAMVVAHVTSANIPAIMVTHDREDAEAAKGPIITLR
ncbi:MAG: ATP-binding cassette domain-containing protein [Deltaproteobacteria bacterium]